MTHLTESEANELRRLCDLVKAPVETSDEYQARLSALCKLGHAASRILDELAELRAENFALAADQCHAGYGDEGGSHRCKEVDAALAERDEARRLLRNAVKSLANCDAEQLAAITERDQALAREAELLNAMQKVKFLAVTAGSPDEMPVLAALARMVRIAIDVGVTEQLPELRTAVIAGPARAALKAPIAEGWEDYDFIYDQDDWETTYDAGDASMILVNLRENGDVHKFSTLRKGQPVFAAYVVTLRDEDGEEFEGEWKWFPSKEAAQAAVAALPAPPTTGEQ